MDPDQLLSCLPQPAALCLESAADAHGIPILSLPGRATRPTLTFPPGRHAPRVAAELHRLHLRPGELVMVGERPATSIIRTLLDLARLRDLRIAVAAMDAAVPQLISHQELDGAVTASADRGHARCVRALSLVDQRAGSVLESAARVTMVLGGVQGLESQFRPPGWGHAFDFALRWARLLIEIDGLAFHENRAQRLRDFEQTTLVQLDGFRICRFGYEHVLLRPDWFLETIHRHCAGWPRPEPAPLVPSATARRRRRADR